MLDSPLWVVVIMTTGPGSSRPYTLDKGRFFRRDFVFMIAGYFGRTATGCRGAVTWWMDFAVILPQSVRFPAGIKLQVILIEILGGRGD